MNFKTILTVCFLLFTSNAIAGDYVCWDINDNITSKYQSMGDNQELLRPTECLSVSRDEMLSLTGNHKHDGSLVGFKFRVKTQTEIDVILQAQADAQALALEEQLDKFDVSNLELMTALIQRINVRIPANPITKAEMIQQLRDNR